MVYEIMKKRGMEFDLVIHQHGEHTLLGTDRFVLKDFAKMVSPGLNLDKFLEANGFPGKEIGCLHSLTISHVLFI